MRCYPSLDRTGDTVPQNGAAVNCAIYGKAGTLADGRAGPAAEACGRSFGWINASYGNPEPYVRLRFQSLLEYRRLEWETGGQLTVKWGDETITESVELIDDPTEIELAFE